MQVEGGDKNRKENSISQKESSNPCFYLLVSPLISRLISSVSGLHNRQPKRMKVKKK